MAESAQWHAQALGRTLIFQNHPKRIAERTWMDPRVQLRRFTCSFSRDSGNPWHLTVVFRSLGLGHTGLTVPPRLSPCHQFQTPCGLSIGCTWPLDLLLPLGGFLVLQLSPGRQDRPPSG